MRKVIIAAALALGTVSATAPAAAQVQVPVGLVNVTIAIDDIDILNNFLSGAEITALNNIAIANDNQINVQAPIGIAANVCGTTVAALVQEVRAGDNECNAEAGSRAFANLVRRQVLRGQQ